MDKMKAAATAAGAGLGLAAGLLFIGRRRLFGRRGRGRELAGQVALITGGSRGLGFALAREFARRGCRIAICGRNEQTLARARESLEREGAEAVAFPCDVSNKSSVESLIEKVRTHYGAIDILVPNAGEIQVGPVENMTVEDFERAMNVMFWGVVYPVLAVLPEMRARRRGRIGVITSIGGKISVPHLLPYSCAKFAAVGFCEGLRAEMAPQGIHVTTIAPGLMRTGSHRAARFKGQTGNEAVWFSLSATLPLISMRAERAARQIVNAIARGDAEKILTVQANAAARLHGLFPGLITDLLGLAAAWMPKAEPQSNRTEAGTEYESRAGFWFRTATLLGRMAAERLNQVPA